MVINNNLICLKIKNSFSHLLICRFGWIKFEFLGHFLNFDFFIKIIVLNYRVTTIKFIKFFRISDTSVNKLIWSVLVSFKSLMTNLFFSVNQTILISVMIKVHFSKLVIYLNQFFPMICMFRTFIVLNCFKFIRKPPSKKKFISSKLKERPDFFNYQPFKVFINC